MGCDAVQDVAVSAGPCLPAYGDWVGAYLAGLRAQGYKETTLRTYGRSLNDFGRYAQRRGVRESGQLPDWIGPFVTHVGSTGHGPRMWRCMIRRFLLYLQQNGLMPRPPASGDRTPHEDLVTQYISYQREHRGVCVEYSKSVTKCCMAFLAYLDAHGVGDPTAIRPDNIHGFIVQAGGHYSRRTMSWYCYALRGFLTYLHRRNITPTDLSLLVIAPRVFRQEDCPRFLMRSEVLSVLAAVDRRTVQGRRDYAMLSLLSTYGLRGIEVIRLLLDDIDWREERLCVHSRKAGNNTVYPLAPSVGNAILCYLRDGRPESSHRQMFLTVKAPCRPFAYTCALGCLVRRYMARSGVTVDRPGTHTFRYSCAQRLLDSGTPLKSIGDYLGHRNPETTQRYTKMALEQLRQVALGDGEDMP